MRSNYKRLGDYIREVSIKNSDSAISNLLGVSNEKYFMPSIANINGTDLSKYKTIKQGQFAYGPVTSRNGDKVSIALLEEDEAIVSTSYTTFEIINHEKLLPEYLALWFKRPEFDRYARFMSHGSVREIFDWGKMCDVELPVPSIKKQIAMVTILKTIQQNINKSNLLIDGYRDFARLLYSKNFKTYVFNNNSNKIYQNSANGLIEIEESKINPEWKVVRLIDIVEQIKTPIKTGKHLFDKKYVPIDIIPKNRLVLDDFISGREANSSLISFGENDILLGAMRVYFHRVSLASFSGITRSTVFVLRPINKSDLATVLMSIDDDDTISYATNNSRGTTMPYTVWEDGLAKYKIILPSSDIRIIFNAKIQKILNYSVFQTNKISKLNQLKEELYKNLSSIQ